MYYGQKFFLVIGRVFLAIIFLLAGVNKILDWGATEENLSMMLSNWINYTSHIEMVSKAFEFLLPWSSALLGIAAFLEIFGGLLVFFGLADKAGAVLLLIFLIPTTIIFHHFWFLEGSKHDLELIMFLKNTAIIGGLFILLAVNKKPKHQNV